MTTDIRWYNPDRMTTTARDLADDALSALHDAAAEEAHRQGWGILDWAEKPGLATLGWWARDKSRRFEFGLFGRAIR